MGKGYTITRGRISQSGTIKIAIFMTIYVFVYIALFIYQAEVIDKLMNKYIILWNFVKAIIFILMMRENSVR